MNYLPPLLALLVAVTPLCAQVASPPAPAPSVTPSVSGPEPIATPTPKPKPTPVPRTPTTAVTPVNRNAGRHARFLERAHQPVGLLFLGDSITDFWPGRGPESWAKFAPYQPADFGISGERTEDVLYRIENGELDGIHPKAVVLMIGTNNLSQSTEQPEWTTAGVKKIVETIHAKLPETKLLLLGIFPRGKANNKMRAEIKTVNDELAKLDDGKKTRYLDIGHAFLDPQGEIPKDVMPDGLHPSAKGYDLWYSAIQPLLEEMLK